MAKLPDLTPVKSSMMTGYAYDPNTRDLTVQFTSGAAYRYADVSAEKVEAMAGNKSIGGFFSAKIRDHHSSVKL
jgi:hypothetical protein